MMLVGLVLLVSAASQVPGNVTALSSGSTVSLGCLVDDDEFVATSSNPKQAPGQVTFVSGTFQCKTQSVVSGVLKSGGFECCRASTQAPLVRTNDRSVGFPIADGTHPPFSFQAREALCPSTHPFLFGIGQRVATFDGNDASTRVFLSAGSQAGFTNPNYKCGGLMLGGQPLTPSGALTEVAMNTKNSVGNYAQSIDARCPIGQVAIGFKITDAIAETGFFHPEFVICSAVAVQ